MTAIDYEPFGPIKRWNWALRSGQQPHSRQSDLAGRQVRYPLGPYLRDVRYDAANRIASYTHYQPTPGSATQGTTAPALDQQFAYDPLDRVTQITTASRRWAFTYDANGNRTSVALDGAAPAPYTVAPTSNRITALSNPPISLTYDAAGNALSDGSYTLGYDLRNRLATLSASGATHTYTYNNAGQRVRKFSSVGAGSAVVFVYDLNDQLLGEYDANGQTLREYVWLDGMPVAMVVPDAADVNNPKVYYIHTDHLNTPRVLVDQDNNVRWTWLGEPFGTSLAENNPAGLGAITFNLRFPGQFYDAESGMHYNLNRHYVPGLGRYSQSDPIGLAGGVNTYLYVGANPVSYTDPLGLFVPSNHNGITRDAVSTAGDVCPDLAAGVALADFLPGSQLPANSAWHAMRNGLNPNETVGAARKNFENYVTQQLQTCTCAGLARALHAIQDSFSQSHAGFQPWNGSKIPSPSHIYKDSYPTKGVRRQAVEASASAINRYKEQCLQCRR
jgi:RHS repeat-associated protein